MAIINQFPMGGDSIDDIRLFFTCYYDSNGLKIPANINGSTDVFLNSSTSGSTTASFAVMKKVKLRLKCFESTYSSNLSSYETYIFEPGYYYSITIDTLYRPSASFVYRTNGNLKIYKRNLGSSSNLETITYQYCSGEDATGSTSTAELFKLEKI